jgi:GNAT superfamily N-acetyltransferase
MKVRLAEPGETEALARLWYDGWWDAHASIMPAELARDRTLENFAARLQRALDEVRAVGPIGAPVGFCMLKGDELYQLYVSAEARGTGAAATLIADAEARLSGRGAKTAWLDCAIGNERAARFYEKSGWRRAGTVVSQLETAGGPFDLEIWRFEKDIRSADRA